MSSETLKIENSSRKSPFFEQKIGGSSIDLQSFKDYNPKISGNIEPIPEFLSYYLKNQEHLDTFNLHGTNHARLDTFIENILRTRSVNMQSLQPKDAVILASTILADSITYDDAAGKLVELGVDVRNDGNGLNSELKRVAERQNKIDRMPADQILMGTKIGICRNYTRLFIAVLEGLKRIQKKNGGSTLSNIYGVPVGTTSHDFVMLLSIGPGSSLQLTPIDPTQVDFDFKKRQENQKSNQNGLIVSDDLNMILTMNFFAEARYGYETMGGKKLEILTQLAQCSDPERIGIYIKHPEVITVNLKNILQNATRKRVATLLYDIGVKRV